jgi:hypothetical protein
MVSLRPPRPAHTLTRLALFQLKPSIPFVTQTAWLVRLKRARASHSPRQKRILFVFAKVLLLTLPRNVLQAFN